MQKTRKALKDLQEARKALFRSAFAERNAAREADAALKRIEECKAELEVALTEELQDLDKQLDYLAGLEKTRNTLVHLNEVSALDGHDELIESTQRHIIGGLR